MNNLPNFDRNLTCCTVLEMAHYADWNYNIIFYFLKLSQLSQNWISNNLPNFYWNLTCSTVLKLVHHADYNYYQIFYFLNFSLLSQLSQKVFLNYFKLNLRAQARQCFIVFVRAPARQYLLLFLFLCQCFTTVLESAASSSCLLLFHVQPSDFLQSILRSDMSWVD